MGIVKLHKEFGLKGQRLIAPTITMVATRIEQRLLIKNVRSFYLEAEAIPKEGEKGELEEVKKSMQATTEYGEKVPERAFIVQNNTLLFEKALCKILSGVISKIMDLKRKAKDNKEETKELDRLINKIQKALEDSYENAKTEIKYVYDLQQTAEGKVGVAMIIKTKQTPTILRATYERFRTRLRIRNVAKETSRIGDLADDLNKIFNALEKHYSTEKMKDAAKKVDKMVDDVEDELKNARILSKENFMMLNYLIVTIRSLIAYDVKAIKEHLLPVSIAQKDIADKKAILEGIEEALQTIREELIQMERYSQLAEKGELAA